MSRAAFIVLDGLDGTGKSTQCRLLADRLRAEGHEVVTCVDPGGTELGAQLRELLLHHRGDIAPACEALLFMASRAQLIEEIIRPALAAGKIVVSAIASCWPMSSTRDTAGGLDVNQLWQVGKTVGVGGSSPI